MRATNSAHSQAYLQKGATLVELMIGLVILGVVLTFAVPAAQEIIIKNRIVAEINEISGIIQYARANAVDEQLETVVCPSANFAACTTDWSQVKMVFGDEDVNGSRANDEEILAATSLLSSNNYIVGPAQAIRFLPNGSANNLSTLLICHADKDAKFARLLTVTPQGRVKMSQDRDRNGIHENDAGADLACP